MLAFGGRVQNLNDLKNRWELIDWVDSNACGWALTRAAEIWGGGRFFISENQILGEALLRFVTRM